MTHHEKHHKVIEKIKHAYKWAKHKLIDEGEAMTPELAMILMLGYHVLGDYKKEHIEEYEEKEHHHGSLSEEEAKERVAHIMKKTGRSIHYTEEKVKELMHLYPQLTEFDFWDVYFIMNYTYAVMYDGAFPDKLYLKAGTRMLEKMDSIKHFAYMV